MKSSVDFVKFKPISIERTSAARERISLVRGCWSGGRLEAGS
jgi:hypothetical protein